jgi:hypothetical protein
MNSAVTNGQTMIRRFLCDFHPATMVPFIRELEPRPREEVMQYSIPAEHFPYPALILPSAASSLKAYGSVREREVVAVTEVSAPAPAPAPAVAKSAYVPPHLRVKAPSETGPVPVYHGAKAPEPKPEPAPAPAAPAGYVPPHLRRKTGGAEPMTITKLSGGGSGSGSGGKKKEEFPALGGAGTAKPKNSIWSKETSFATIAAAPAPVDAEPEVETQASIMMRENERLRQLMLAQTRQREIAKFDAMAVRENGGVAYGGGSDDEDAYGGGGSDDDGAYDDDDAENDKYYA